MITIITIIFIIVALAVLTLTVELRGSNSDRLEQAWHRDTYSRESAQQNGTLEMKRYGTRRNTEPETGLGENDIAVDLALTFHEGIFGVITTLEYSRLKRSPDGTLMATADTLKLTVPAGVVQNTRLRVNGKGNDSISGATGDIYIYLQMPYEYKGLKRRENNILSTLQLTAEQAEQGGEFSILAVDGKEMTITVPRGIRRNEDVRLVEGGVPVLGQPQKRGLHIVSVDF